MITLHPNAKINLGLNIVEKRPDGYHNLETVFYPVKGLYDVLSVGFSGGLSDDKINLTDKKSDYRFSGDGIQVDGETDNNLIIKALKILKQDFEIPCIDIRFTKNIPFGAGLGGGSADAAFMLKALNDLCQLQLSNEQLEAYAVRIGADCPVFIENKPVFATGIGNIFSQLELDLSAYYLVLVKPDIHVSTPEAYSMVKPYRPATSLKENIHAPIEQWKELIVNDFETSVFTKHPRIGAIKNQLYTHGALYASMSGSGSSVFGIFQQPTQLSDQFPDSFVFEGKL